LYTLFVKISIKIIDVWGISDADQRVTELLIAVHDLLWGWIGPLVFWSFAPEFIAWVLLHEKKEGNLLVPVSVAEPIWRFSCSSSRTLL